jgi:hypothetical protein
LTEVHERLDKRGDAKLRGLLRAGDPRGEVQMTWHAKETIRSICDHDLACEFVDRLTELLRDESMPDELRSLGRTIARWRDQIVAWHRARVSNGPTEALNLVKWDAFGITNFRNHRIRALLYAGKPDWGLLATTTPR